ncbi:citrate synthase family member [Catenaria anguillulae PL171]|uniref:Citrate synthase n=1 Tax=Catenaria anguillulae PL171 TaxID=765915 RepID=A0A1Y2I1C0_9FUNG|nr:citrate synthase family member [Catenaria anguillulae PL171]
MSAAAAAAPHRQHPVKIRDNRTGQESEVEVVNGSIRSSAFAQFGLGVLDNGYLNTAVVKSQITYIDGARGILRHRGIPIEQLAEKSTFLEVSYLLLHGELPSADVLAQWTHRIMHHTFVHENLIQFLQSFRYDAHPMGMLVSAVAALETFHPEASTDLQGDHIYSSDALRNKQIFRLLGKMPTIAACAYRHRIGRPYNYPKNGLGYTENFLYMLDSLGETDYKPNPVLARALDVCFILHADHELNCSTAAFRQIASTGIDPYVCVAGAASALYGPSHGGANEAALRMLEEIGTVDRIPEFLAQVKAKTRRLMGFGHRLYKSYDPRAAALRKVAHQVFEVMGRNPLIDVAVELERVALNDDYFKSRKLFPNVDFYSGIIYKSMGFPADMFPVLFCIARTAGWLAHWNEQLADSEIRIFRPQQAYDGPAPRKYVPMGQRVAAPVTVADGAPASGTSAAGALAALAGGNGNTGASAAAAAAPVVVSAENPRKRHLARYMDRASLA